jgi:hypothetical protein
MKISGVNSTCLIHDASQRRYIMNAVVNKLSDSAGNLLANSETDVISKRNLCSIKLHSYTQFPCAQGNHRSIIQVFMVTG